jgi:uncharacterized protein
MVNQHLIKLIRQQFALEWDGIHGAPHWARVKENGLRLAEQTGARTNVVELFAFLHDSRRLNDGSDPDHGKRAGEFARSLTGTVIDLGQSDLELLVAACEGHSEGSTQGDITVCTCWDADRLDLGRVHIMPRAERLCTEAARDPAVIEWAYKRSVR